MKTKLILLTALLIVSALAFTLTTYAAIPHLMNYQGKATDKAGVPLNGAYNLTLRIYNSETGGAPKWTETQSSIPISNGIFQVQLGSVTPLNLPFDEPYWISLEINTDGEMSPRIKLASVPYAHRAESLSGDPVISFYRKGFDIEYIDFNSIKISAGVMDVAGKMFATTAYSNPLLLEYVDSPKDRDWIHGSKAPNITAYVYAYNNNGQVSFKLSDEAPNLSDQYGNTAQQPYLYRRYPDADGGLYYRYIGQAPLNSAGNFNSALINSLDVSSQNFLLYKVSDSNPAHLTTLFQSNDAEVATTSYNPVIVKTITINSVPSNSVPIYVSARCEIACDVVSQPIKCRIAHNGNEVGTYDTVSGGYHAYSAVGGNIAIQVREGDTITVKLGGNGANTEYCRNFRLYCSDNSSLVSNTYYIDTGIVATNS